MAMPLATTAATSTGLLPVMCHSNQCGVVYSPLEELHEQADIEQASEDEEQTVPQTDACVESVKVQIVVVADSPDDWKKQDNFIKSYYYQHTEQYAGLTSETRRAPLMKMASGAVVSGMTSGEPANKE